MKAAVRNTKQLGAAISRLVERTKQGDDNEDIESMVKRSNKAETVNAMPTGGSNFDAEMMKSMRYQALLETLNVGKKYLYCMQHGFVSHEERQSPICTICGSKMIMKKYLG